MIIPVIIGGITLLTAAFSASKVTEAIDNNKEAEHIIQSAEQRFKGVRDELEKRRKSLEKSCDDLLKTKHEIKSTTIDRYVARLKTIKNKVNYDKWEVPSNIDFQQVKIDIGEVDKWAPDFDNLLNSASKGVGVCAALSGAASSIGVASTGASIGSLSGAAATNAFYAWLGGGSLAAGGGGMALGAVMLGGITIAPALLIMGCSYAKNAEKNLTKARDYEAEVDQNIATMMLFEEKICAVITRVKEIVDLIKRIDEKLKNEIIKIEKRFDDNKPDHWRILQNCSLYVKALKELMTMPIIDDNTGSLTDSSLELIQKYSKI